MSKSKKYNTRDIKHIVDNITSMSKDLIPVGGFRRGSPIVHDIDFISLLSFDELLPKLDSLKDHVFKLPTNIKNNRKKIKFDYIIDDKQKIQIDIFYVKKEEYPFALLHYTGNYLFNIYVRTIAIKKGYKLNQYGLFLINDSKVNENKSQEQLKKEKEQLININSERNIFDFLNLEWKEPSERDIGESDHIHWKKMSTTVTGGKRKKTRKTSNRGGDCGCSKSERTEGGKSKRAKVKTNTRSTVSPPPLNIHKKPLNTLPEDSILNEDNNKSVPEDVVEEADDDVGDDDVNVEGGRRRKRKSGGIFGGLGRLISNIFGGSNYASSSNYSTTSNNPIRGGMDDQDDNTMPDRISDINPALGGMDTRELQLRGVKSKSRKRSSKSGGTKTAGKTGGKKKRKSGCAYGGKSGGKTSSRSGGSSSKSGGKSRKSRKTKSKK